LSRQEKGPISPARKRLALQEQKLSTGGGIRESRNRISRKRKAAIKSGVDFFA